MHKGNSSIVNAPLVTIITVVYNNIKHIRGAIESVLSQDYERIEYVVIDGGSSDGTQEVIQEYHDKIDIYVSEPDEGIYDALNKGIRHSSGDVIGILHSDDLFCDVSVVSDCIAQMRATGAEFCFSDMVIVNEELDRIIRYYKASYFNKWMFRIGWLPPHPTVFMHRTLFDQFGLYSIKYKAAGDFEFFVRIFYGKQIAYSYLDRVTVMMRSGGTSNSGVSSKLLVANEIDMALRENNVFSHSLIQIFRYILRMFEFVLRPSKNRFQLKKNDIS